MKFRLIAGLLLALIIGGTYAYMYQAQQREREAAYVGDSSSVGSTGSESDGESSRRSDNSGDASSHGRSPASGDDQSFKGLGKL